MSLFISGCATEKTQSAPSLSDQTAVYVEEARAGMRNDKLLIINQAMNLGQGDQFYDAFWHQYYQYEAERKAINDRRLQLIRDFEFNYDRMNDDIANDLAERALLNRKDRLALLEKYYLSMKEATSPVIAARFLQVENDIGLMIDLEVASNLPLLRKSP
jgi:hypothetical protein